MTREICLRTNSKALLAGSIAGIGSQYVIGLKAVNCQTGDTLASAEATAEGRNQVLKALGDAGNQLRGKLGESLASVEKYNKPLEQATTSSLEALKAFTEGRRIQRERGDVPENISYLKRAVELDPNFARAYVALGVGYANLNQTGVAIENFKKAYTLRERVSDRERFAIEADYYLYATGELEKSNESYTEWVQAYPQDSIAYANLGNNYNWLGQYEKAVAATRSSLQLVPDNGIAFGNLVQSYLALNRLDEAKTTVLEALQHKVDTQYLHLFAYLLAFLQGDASAMREQVAWAMGKPDAEDWQLSAESDTQAWYGRLNQSRELAARAVESAKHSDAKEAAALWQVTEALREAELGNAAKARQASAEALALSSERDTATLAALALSRAGDSAQAQKIADNLNREAPVNTLIQKYWLPTIQASLELNRGNPQRAIELLQPASSYELGLPLPLQSNGTLYPAYVRGAAYLMAGQGQQAAAEFQKLLDHRGVVLNFPLGALAHLQLARSYVLAGDKSKARSAYQDFLALWKDADPDIPILKEAKSEYAKLQ